MPIRNPNGQGYGVFANGVDDTTVIGSPDIAGTLSKADNTDLISDSLCKKRNGFTAQVTAWSNRRGRGGLEYKKTDGTSEVLFYGEGSSLTGTSGVFGKQNGSGVPIIIKSGLADGIKPSIIQFRNLAMCFTGTQSFLYDGSGTRQIGISPSLTAPTLNHLSYNYGVSTGTEPFAVSSSYLFLYTYYNSKTGAESSPSPASSAMVFSDTTSTGGTAVTINITAGDSATADTINIYRSVNGGSIFFLEGTTGISSTSYVSTRTDAGLGVELELDNSRLFAEPKFAIVNGDNRVIVGGFTNNPNRLQYSKVGINGSMPESFQVADFIDCNLNDGDRILGLGKAGENIIVIKERSVGRLVSVQGSFGGLERGGSQKYLYREISSEVTGVSHDCIVSLDNIIVWLGRDEIYGTDGGQIFRFGERIRNKLGTLNFEQAVKFSSINKTDTKQIIFSVCRAGISEPDYQLVGHYRSFPKIAWTYYTPGPNTVTHPGITAASMFTVTVNKRKTVWFGSSASNGLFSRLDSGTSDNGNGIYWDVRLPWDGASSPASEKLFHSYYIFATGAGKSPNNVITHTFEKDKVESVVVSDTSVLSGTSTAWHTSNWADFNWSAVPFIPLKFFPHQRAYFGRYGFNNTYADQPCAVLAVTRIAQVFPIH